MVSDPNLLWANLAGHAVGTIIFISGGGAKRVDDGEQVVSNVIDLTGDAGRGGTFCEGATSASYLIAPFLSHGPKQQVREKKTGRGKERGIQGCAILHKVLDGWK
jgi:hypothetical protein